MASAAVRPDPTWQRPRSIAGVNVHGKRVLVRADLNVPLGEGRVADDTRIRAALPTLELLRERGATAITVCSHLGRPRGYDPSFSLAPVETRLRELFDGPLTVLENTRFDPGETANDPAFAHALALGHDLFVQDAFGSVHRSHASTVGVAKILPAYAGLLLEREVDRLGRLLGEVERPFVLVCGGAKVDDKLAVLRRLGGRADAVLVGGKLAAQLRVFNPLDFPVELPDDVVAAERLDGNAASRVCRAENIPYGWVELDIGPVTRERFAATIASARTIFWNGPLGAFELPPYAAGTEAVARAIAAADAYSVVGGGDSLRALAELGLSGRVSWASTGGGAALAFLAGEPLPGIAAIPAA
ncbi:MAG TPA: phosphoglycerate kinase [Gaiellaceae bacterium]|jgi:phosphoglycerate kinase|nr:phosphoglycerate kinase [Gaiellaceae bacterium]